LPARPSSKRYSSPQNRPRRPRGGVDYSSILSLNSAQVGGGWSTPRPGRFTLGKDPVTIVQEAEWVPWPVWTGAKNFAPTEIRSMERSARSKSLTRPTSASSLGSEAAIWKNSQQETRSENKFTWCTILLPKNIHWLTLYNLISDQTFMFPTGRQNLGRCEIKDDHEWKQLLHGG